MEGALEVLSEKAVGGRVAFNVTKEVFLAIAKGEFEALVFGAIGKIKYVKIVWKSEEAKGD